MNSTPPPPPALSRRTRTDALPAGTFHARAGRVRRGASIRTATGRASPPPQLHPLFTEEGIEHLREKGRYYDPNDVYEPESTSTPTPTPAPTAAPAVLPTPPPGSPSAALTEDKLKRTRDKATITLDSNWSAAWYYSADTGPHANSCTAVDAGTHDVNLTGLGAGTRFTYTAYSDSNCATVLGSVAFSTAVVAANNSLGSYMQGQRITATTRKLANSFTTGAHSAGYDLKQIIGKFDRSGGTPDPIRVAIHADSSGSPGNRIWTLTNFNGSPIHNIINGDHLPLPLSHHHLRPAEQHDVLRGRRYPQLVEGSRHPLLRLAVHRPGRPAVDARQQRLVAGGHAAGEHRRRKQLDEQRERPGRPVRRRGVPAVGARPLTRRWRVGLSRGERRGVPSPQPSPLVGRGGQG